MRADIAVNEVQQAAQAQCQALGSGALGSGALGSGALGSGALGSGASGSGASGSGASFETVAWSWGKRLLMKCSEGALHPSGPSVLNSPKHLRLWPLQPR